MEFPTCPTRRLRPCHHVQVHCRLAYQWLQTMLVGAMLETPVIEVLNLFRVFKESPVISMRQERSHIWCAGSHHYNRQTHRPDLTRMFCRRTFHGKTSQSGLKHRHTLTDAKISVADSRNGLHYSYQYERWRHWELLGQGLVRILTTETKSGVFRNHRQEIACTASAGTGKWHTSEP